MEEALKQAKIKALRLLECMERTEQQLRLKLKQKGFEDVVVEEAIQYVKSYGYINDASYAERFVINKQNSKSRREIYAMLLQKGIRKEDVDAAMEKQYRDEDAEEAIRRLCEKKHFVASESTDVEKKKIYDFLLRKGFRSDDIRRVLKVSE